MRHHNLRPPVVHEVKELQTALDTENPHAEGGFVLPKMSNPASR